VGRSSLLYLKQYELCIRYDDKTRLPHTYHHQKSQQASQQQQQAARNDKNGKRKAADLLLISFVLA